jgi:hypothetical protein
MTLTSGVNAVNKSFVTHVIIIEQLKLAYIDAALVTKKKVFLLTTVACTINVLQS